MCNCFGERCAPRREIIPAVWIVFGLAFVVAGISNSAAATTYTDQPSFLNNVQTGFYLEPFDSPASFPPPPLFFSMNGFSYTASTPDDHFILGGVLTTIHQGFDIVFTLTSNNITAVGGDFSLGNPLPLGVPMPEVTVTLDDGTSFTRAFPTFGFIGFTEASPIQSVTVSAPEGGFVTIDNFIAGAAAAVPEPPVSVFVGLGLVAFACLHLKARRQAKALNR